jgi:hypothetical protein
MNVLVLVHVNLVGAFRQHTKHMPTRIRTATMAAMLLRAAVGVTAVKMEATANAPPIKANTNSYCKKSF